MKLLKRVLFFVFISSGAQAVQRDCSEQVECLVVIVNDAQQDNIRPLIDHSQADDELLPLVSRSVIQNVPGRKLRMHVGCLNSIFGRSLNECCSLCADRCKAACSSLVVGACFILVIAGVVGVLGFVIFLQVGLPALLVCVDQPHASYTSRNLDFSECMWGLTQSSDSLASSSSLSS